MIELRGLLKDQIDQLMIDANEKAFRSSQICDWLYRKNINDIDLMKNLSKPLREKLKETTKLSLISLEEVLVSQDKSRKYIFKTHDGHLFESVMIAGKKRKTACLSSQIGCVAGCTFCVTGDSKFVRNLTAAEITEQVHHIKNDIGRDITNVVFMGTGEPLLNYDNVVQAIKILNADWGFNIGARKITVSTCGIVPGIYKLADSDLNVRLAVSLNAPTNEKRSSIMPINRKYPLNELLGAVTSFSEVASRFVTFEYVMLDGINDTQNDARALITLLKGISCKINIIPYNDNPYKGMKSSSDEKIAKFMEVIEKYFSSVTLRKSAGRDILAACGQLKANYIKDNENI